MRLMLLALIVAFLVGCAGAPTEGPTPTQSPVPQQVSEEAGEPTERPTRTPQPTLTPAITATPIPTQVPEQATEEPPLPTPLPTEARTYNLCVGIASDSNGFGHVTFQRPDTGQIGITYIAPLAVPLRAHLDSRGLDYLTVEDHSLSAAGLTTATSNYLDSDQLFRLKAARCQFNVVTPFYPDVAVNLAQPEEYITNLGFLLDHFTSSNPQGTILVLNYYQTDRAEFTIDNNGLGLTATRINAFNRALAAACQPDGALGQVEQVICVDVRPYFQSMESYVLTETTRADFEAALYRTTTFTPMLQEYFEENPEGALIGDGIHLSLAGRDRLAERLADEIYTLVRNQGD